MKVYLSTPYEVSRAEQSWKKRALATLRYVDVRFSVLDPCPTDCIEDGIAETMKLEGNWLGFYTYCANIVEGDLAMLNNCQGMIAYLPADSVTVGTIHEIVHAMRENIPIVLVMPEGVDRVSRWLWGFLGPNRIFDNLEEAAEVLANRILVANGEKLNGEVYYPSWQKASR